MRRLTLVLLVVATVLLASCAPAAAPTPEVITKIETQVVKETQVVEKLVTPVMEYPDEVRIGVVLPLTAGAAIYGEQTRAGLDVALEEINSSGGIESLGGAKINLIYGDSKSTPDGALAESERLVNQENVAVLMGAFQSGVTFAASTVAEKYHVPWHVLASVKDEITKDRGFKYIFRDQKFTGMDAEQMVPVLNAFAEATGVRPKTYALLVEGGDWGRSTGTNLKKLFAGEGYELVMEEVYPSGQADFTAQVLKLKEAQPDMLHLCMYTADHILFSKEAMAQELYFPFGIFSYGGGSEDPTLYTSLPPEAVEYMFVEEDWDMRRMAEPWYPYLNDIIKAKLGYDIGIHVIRGYAQLYTLKDVLERAVYSPDLATYRDNIRDAYAATYITPENAYMRELPSGEKFAPSLIRGVSRVVFDAEGQNPFAYGNVSQIIDGERTMLFTMWDDLPTGKLLRPPVWPIPPWDER